MSGTLRLGSAISAGDLELPASGRIAAFAPRAGMDLSPLGLDRCHVIAGFKPDSAYFSAQGYRCDVAPEGPYAAAVVFVPRARAQAQALVAQAAALTQGPVFVEGAKTDGIEALLKSCRTRASVSFVMSKAHGKLFVIEPGAEFEDWVPGPAQQIEGGFVTAPGVFSADGIDPASRLLADALPARLGKTVADLGAGWGYLSARLLERPDVEHVHLVEAEWSALACAKTNLTDPRAKFHWNDVAQWQPTEVFDSVITNPPFHTARTPDPAIGQAFIRTAARILIPRGQLFLVANRHLPYESELARHFSEVKELGGDNRFKLLHALRPMRKAR